MFQIENSFFTYDPQVFVIVYSVEDRGSFETAKEMLEYLRNYRGCSANNGMTFKTTKIKKIQQINRLSRNLKVNHVIFFAVRFHGVDRAVILVGNKVDLQRCRVVTPKGKQSNIFFCKMVFMYPITKKSLYTLKYIYYLREENFL